MTMVLLTAFETMVAVEHVRVFLATTVMPTKLDVRMTCRRRRRVEVVVMILVFFVRVHDGRMRLLKGRSWWHDDNKQESTSLVSPSSLPSSTRKCLNLLSSLLWRARAKVAETSRTGMQQTCSLWFSSSQKASSFESVKEPLFGCYWRLALECLWVVFFGRLVSLWEIILPLVVVQRQARSP